MKSDRSDILLFFVIALFIVAPFVMSIDSVKTQELISARILPSYVTKIASYFRWAILFLLILSPLFYLPKNNNIKITSPVWLLSLFYFIQFLVALVDGVEYIRFLSMTVLCLMIPPVIGYVINDNKIILKYFIYIISFFLLLSIILNFHLTLSGYRFYGFMKNPNAYGISTVFWITILLLANKQGVVGRKLFWPLLIIIFMTMLLSGSRNALVGVLLIIFIHYHNQLGKLIMGIIVLIIVVVIFSHFIEISFIMNRIGNIFSSFSDSGRNEIWELTYPAIKSNFWMGNGMDANYRIAYTGNVHNCYLRFVLNMGMSFTIIALFFYFLSIFEVVLKRKKVPVILTGYLIVFSVMNIGEDFFVGLGSSSFIYLLFIYGYINYYITHNDTIG